MNKEIYETFLLYSDNIDNNTTFDDFICHHVGNCLTELIMMFVEDFNTDPSYGAGYGWVNHLPVYDDETTIKADFLYLLSLMTNKELYQLIKAGE